MAIEILTEVFYQEIPSAEKFLLVTLANYTDENGRCYPSRELLAERLCKSERSVSRLVTSLINMEWISRSYNGRGGCVYQINMDRLGLEKGLNRGGNRGRKSSQSGANKSKESGHNGANNPEEIAPLSTVNSAKNDIPIYNRQEPSLNTQPSKSAIPSEKVLLSERSWFSAWWSYAFKIVTGESYFLGASGKGSDTGIISNLFRNGDLYDIVTRACSYVLLSDSDRWPKGPPTLFGFNQAINQLAGSFDEVIDRCIDLKLLPDFVISDDEIVTWLPWDRNYQKNIIDEELKGACHGEN